MNQKEYNIGDIVYHVTDEENTAYMVTGIVERLNHYTYLISNKGGEVEALSLELSINKKHF